MKLLQTYAWTMSAPQIAVVLLRSHRVVGFSSHHYHMSSSSSSSTVLLLRSSSDAAFSAFAETLEEDELFSDENNDMDIGTWQESLDKFLDPMTPPGKKQVLLSDLVSANEEIRQSVETALKERTLDPILTPTTKKLQDGTRAVARQITNDILPSLAASSSSVRTNVGILPTAEELPTLVPKVTSRIFDAISAQAKKQVSMLQQDLADPTRIPQRISQQTMDLAQEARNMFLETPEGLVTPNYRVISKSECYEIREYEGYTAASTTMSKIGEPYSLSDITSSGTAFNSLAAYIFGANDQEQTLQMTTPVITTSNGEMRFYLQDNYSSNNSDFPTPVSNSSVEFNEKGSVSIVKIPSTVVAVARFTGFVTDGEVARQKDALLTRLATDGVELDVPHGKIVPHKIFQYNPPYTIPIVRRNEIAVPIRPTMETQLELKTEWGADVEELELELDNGDLSPSDVE